MHCIHVQHQVSLGSGDSLRAVKDFEKFADSCGVKIKGHRADNHPFNSKLFHEHFEENNQEIDCSGIDAHHQNAIADPHIRAVAKWAQSSLLHECLLQ